MIIKSGTFQDGVAWTISTATGKCKVHVDDETLLDFHGGYEECVKYVKKQEGARQDDTI